MLNRRLSFPTSQVCGVSEFCHHSRHEKYVINIPEKIISFASGARKKECGYKDVDHSEY